MKKLEFFSTDSKQLSFFDFGKGDKFYGKFACKPLDELDNRVIFKKIFHVVFQLAAYGLLIYGIYLLFGNLFGSNGYFKSISEIKSGEKVFKSGEKVFGIILSIISLTTSAVALFYVFSIVNNRSRKLYKKSFTNVLDYIFGHLLPVVFIMIGEIIVVLTLLLFFNQFLSSVSSSPIYNPLTSILALTSSGYAAITYGLLMGLNINFLLPSFDLISFGNLLGGGSGRMNEVYLHSQSFKTGISLALDFLIMSLHTLIFTYVFIEVYKYAYKLVLNIIEFLPKFGIPFAIRHKYDNAKPVEMPEEKNNNKIDFNDI